MKRFYPFFTIGTVGMIVTSMLHIFIALGLSISSAHTSFYILYSTFMAFLAIGFGLTLKTQKESKIT
ncbi:hypothetical protein [Bizionia myxarmorum]|uniref:Uncharacterized protein n=1 Tax=Bizionia myxarmorum TaxID=291186 RepID=A0A5D0R959_9FLAO|nr:hypothetical protein [Bizionia myxarmorum]TYB77218.1 hypothetical protein ES674_11085 [Bizionia myxarmorum]